MLPSYTFLKEKLNKLGNILPKPLISGADLSSIGISNSPKMGKIIDNTYNKQLEEDLSKEELLDWIKEKFGAESGT